MKVERQMRVLKGLHYDARSGACARNVHPGSAGSACSSWARGTSQARACLCIGLLVSEAGHDHAAVSALPVYGCGYGVICRQLQRIHHSQDLRQHAIACAP